MAIKALSPRSYGPEVGLRPNTKLNRWQVHFIFNSGGMGDFINYTAATTWLAKNAPWCEPNLFVPAYILPLMRYIHRDTHWNVFPGEEFRAHFSDGDRIIGPDVLIRGNNVSPQFLTCTGAHPIDVGFAYYAGMTPAPVDGLLPTLNYKPSGLPRELKGKAYVVIPTGNVHEVRATGGRHINPIIDHLKCRGILPVFLGKNDLLGNGIRTTRFPDDVNYGDGLDLRNKTTVLEAACILQHAVCTVGLDCGLLHLSALMKDSKLIFGYNITSVAHREPRRNHGCHINIALTEEDLKCSGCQSKIRMITGHQFDKCIYGDNLCVDLLFKNNSARWTAAIDQFLEA